MAGEQHPFPSTLAHNAVSGQLGFQPEENWMVDGKMCLAARSTA